MHIQYTSSYKSCLELRAMEWAPNFHHQMCKSQVQSISKLGFNATLFHVSLRLIIFCAVELSCFVDLWEVFQVDQAWKSAEIKCPMCPISTQMLIRTKPTTLILLRVSMFDWSNFFMLIIFCQRVDSILDIVCIEVSTFLFFKVHFSFIQESQPFSYGSRKLHAVKITLT